MTKSAVLLGMFACGVVAAAPLADLRLFFTPVERRAIESPAEREAMMPAPVAAGWVRSDSGRSELGQRARSQPELLIRGEP
ncbi:MAG: hypothetical protein AAF460_04515 [Pseudomonadota bacterium]